MAFIARCFFLFPFLFFRDQNGWYGFEIALGIFVFPSFLPRTVACLFCPGLKALNLARLSAPSFPAFTVWYH